MAPPTLAEFTAQFRALDADQRTAFVADLFAAAGWETERDGQAVVATTRGETRRLAVGSPDPDPDLDPEVDAVVTVPSRATTLLGRFVGQPGASAGVETSEPSRVGVASLHERLLYAVDRDRAARLYRAYFDTEFGAGRRRESPDPVGRRVLAALLVVVLVGSAAAAVALSAGTDTGPDAAETDTGLDAAGTEGRTDGGGATAQPAEETPEGDRLTVVSSSEVRDPDRLFQAHSQAIEGVPVEMRAQFHGPRFLMGFDTRRSGYDSQDEVRFVVRAQSPTSYYITRRINFSGNELTSVDARYERYADGTTEYRRLEKDGAVEYDRWSVSSVRSGSETIDGWSRLLVERYLNTTDRRVGVVQRGPVTRYLVVATGEPRGIDHATRDYRAVATVRPDGMITSLRVTYVHPETGAPVDVRLQYNTRSVVVEQPEWYAAAREELDREPTPTPRDGDG